MKKFKTFLPLAFIGICSFVASTSCDTGDRSAEELAELETIFANQSRGFDPAVIANTPNGNAGFPFTLIPGDIITFTPDAPPATRPIPAPSNSTDTFTVRSPNSLQQAAVGNLSIPPGDESIYTHNWNLSNASLQATSHSDATQASITLAPQFSWEALGGNVLTVPPTYAALFEEGGSLRSFALQRSPSSTNRITAAQFNAAQVNSLLSQNFYAYDNVAGLQSAGLSFDGGFDNVGPLIRVNQEITLNLTPITNATLAQRNLNGKHQLTGRYTLTQTYYIIANSTLLPQTDPDQTSVPSVFDDNSTTATDPLEYTGNESGSFTLELETLTLP